MADTGRYRSAFVYFRSFFRKQNHPIPWNSNGSWVRNIKQTIVCTEESVRFFRDHHNHSKDIITIINKGFGRESGILGDCKYHNGLIIVQKPKEPEIADIGLARKHLQDGYPDIWKLKREAESKSDMILTDIEKIKTDFESKIIDEIERETDKTHTKLIRKDYQSSLSDIFHSCYYNELISEIFYEIDMRESGKKPRDLCPHFEYLTFKTVKVKRAVYLYINYHLINKVVL